MGADDAATLSRAVQFLQKEGARSIADVAKYGLSEVSKYVGRSASSRRGQGGAAPSTRSHRQMRMSVHLAVTGAWREPQLPTPP